MRSLASTFWLVLIAAASAGLAVWQWSHGDFHLLLGAPPVPRGERLYPDLDASEVRFIEIAQGSNTATFEKRATGWHAVKPWDDRMDPRAASAIVQFVVGLRAEDHAGRDDLSPERSGLGRDAVRIRLENGSHEPVALLRVGRTTPWLTEVKGLEQPVATVFIQKLERHHKDHIYIGSGDIGPLFKDGFRLLRDHHPFFFHPSLLQTIRIRSSEGELTLAREDPRSAWRIAKPLDTPTDAEAVKSLIEGMMELSASRVSERSEVSLPAPDGSTQTTLLAVSCFNQPGETVLEVFPPATADVRDALAVVSDRPRTVFELPIKPEAGVTTLASLPLSVNELRDPVLTRLNVASIKSIRIEPATASPILITREPPEPWMATIGGATFEANEESLFSLLKTVTTTRALAFESDAATDFTPWGLDRPILTLRFLGNNNEVVELRFGMDGKGGLFCNRLGSPAVMRVDPSLLTAISIRSHEWRHARVWSLSRIDLKGISRTIDNTPPLELAYNDFAETWKATQASVDVTGNLDPRRASFLLTTLETIKVTRWLAADDPNAASALAKPTVSFRLFLEDRTPDGERRGFVEKRLEFAPGGEAAPGMWYGRLLSDPNPFLIDPDTLRRLSVPLLD